ncbi:MAG TPA: metallophosphoesterase [Nitrososphaeraceae archaeon]|nr:metallophosphoesterase [Nitrososphaeraceae archaeon]
MLFLICSNNTTIFAQQSNSQSEFEDINIVVAGDFYCNDETEDTIENIISINPELIITTGDHVKDEISAECWIEMSKPIKDKMKIAIGNHDTEFTNIYKQIVGYHNIKDPYYSHDFQNVHFISMSTEHPFEEKSKQYEFIRNDLEKTSQNKYIDWIIIHQHKPFYSTHNDRKEAKQLRDTFLPLFEKYSVDLIIYGHNQYYERTYPILYNKDIEDIIDEETMPQPIITDNSSSNYKNTKGIKFLTVGTGGDKLSSPKATPGYLVIQNDEEYGFLNLKLEGNGKTIVGEFQTNDGDVIDSFTLQKS